MIRANGGGVWGYYLGGAGGRIALYLTEPGATFDSFEGLVAAYASVDVDNNGTMHPVSVNCGTIYVQTAAELKRVKLVVGAATHLCLAQNLTVQDLTIESDSAKLDLQGHNLKVKAPWHAYPQETMLNAGEWIDGKRPNWSNITWGGSGLVIMFQ